MAEQIIKTEYSEVMQKSYIDYAMSVICARALPDARDGLKPVQRRVLYAMDQLGLNYDKPHRKSARIVGDTMGKYHPHGDSSIYETLVVLAQDFKKGMALVDGHGNFGSIEGDGAAAMRYTEAKLKKFTQDVYLADLDKDVVDFVPNFDETEKEPLVLPVRVPNILVNGAEGIAVGMATNIPTHNLGEVVDAVIAYMDNNNITTEELLQIMPGPDFPTGGIVANKSDLKDIYESGTGKLKLRGKLEFEKGKGREKDKLVITEIPYTMIGAGIGKFISDVIDLVETKKTTDIVDISNGSDENGIRIVLELKKGADVEKLKNILYKKTKLEDTFGVNMLAIADGRPEVMGLKSIIKYNVDFQYELAQRKYTTLLNKALEQKEIKEGLIKATNIIDLIIEIIRGSQSQKQVKACLVHGKTDDIKFKNPESEILAGNLSFTERQAQAILELRLSKLIGLEILALQKEYEELMDKIGQYEDILGNRKTMTKTIKKDLKAIKKEYALPRKTLIEDGKEAVFDENAFVEQEVVFVQDKFGYSKLLDPAAFDRNIESVTKENKYYFRCMNTDSICIFTDNGNVHQIKVSAIPTKKVREKGIPIDNLGNYSSQGESIVTLVSFDMIKDKKLLFTTKNGMIKLVDGSEFETNRKTMLATKLGKDDEVVSVKITRVSNKQISEEQVEEMPVMLTGGSDDFEPLDFEQMELFDTTASMDVGQEQELQYTREILVLQTEEGIFLRFPLKEVPEMKKATLGVKGIKLNDGDFVSKVYLLDTGDNEVVKCNGKTVDLRKLKIGKRGAKGVKVRASKA
ncbi:DNA gyrase/topoisomerase IV subunit A [Eubacterium ventriosum]|uniref:DNA gyrase/topoisomerase IV subunit A n=1 Tax=Eubacterium ventriosum TaxID=39496 RepID=UPI00210DDBA1|nr:DNA topoisomerase (ATP-hydrolyzing) [Eubacterium ventriosum]MCQ5339352.1 DNA topoisomerase 4 subunit A [Eubacterium ventriosum]